MFRLFYIARAVLAGLCLAQLLATLFVYLSNVELGHKIQTLQAAGYLIVPNSRILPTLFQIKYAFYGAFFYTFTLGGALCLIPSALAWVWERLFKRNRYALLVLAGLWLTAVVLTLIRPGPGILISMVCLVPPFVFMATLGWMPAHDPKGLGIRSAVFFLPLFILLGLGEAFIGHDERIFPDIRDYSLLSNPIGRSINRFYYDYTLYPAEILKPLSKKTLKSCRLTGKTDPKILERLEKRLRGYDYLHVKDNLEAELHVHVSGDQIHLKKNGKDLVVVSKKSFLGDPVKPLEDFSKADDRSRPLRRATQYSLILSGTFGFYLFIFSLAYGLLSPFLRVNTATWGAAALCVALGIAALYPLYQGRKAIREMDIKTMPASDSWIVRTAGLKKIRNFGHDIKEYQPWDRFAASPHVPERYWFAVLLGRSRSPEAKTYLRRLLSDPETIVVCQALRSLGMRRVYQARDTVVVFLRTSDDWYAQWYGYRALRRLGWTQSAPD